MESLQIDTTQNISIEHPIASIGERVVAALIDYVFIFFFIAIIGFFVGSLGLNFLGFLIIIPVLFYDLLSELLMNGQTWGKKILQIKVVKIDGSSVTFSSYFLRWVLRLVEITMTFGSLATISIVLNQKGQRLGDLAANTAVVRLRNKSLKGSIYVRIPESYQPVYPQVSILSIHDIYMVNEVLDILKSSNLSMAKKAIVQNAFKVFQKRLEVQSLQTPLNFFQTILTDYNYFKRLN
jgi:uncharacterized RDD family membrane protein YckC